MVPGCTLFAQKFLSEYLEYGTWVYTVQVFLSEHLEYMW